MEHEGWVKLFRSIQSSDIWCLDAPFCPRSAFIDLILLANHKNGNAFNKRKINRGQHWTSLRKLSERWHWRFNKVKDYLATLQCEGMIKVNYEKQGLLITICNYDKYQTLPKGNTSGSASGSTGGSTSGSVTGIQTISDI